MNLTKKRFRALGLLLTLLLAACNMPLTPTPHPSPTPTLTPEPPKAPTASAAAGAACVAGTWQINNLSDLLQTILPQMIEGAQVQVGEITGSLTYTFNPDGTSTGEARDFKIKATVTTSGISLPGQIVVNGTSKGKYQVDENQGLLTLTDVSPGDLAVTASVAGIPVVNNTLITNLLTFGSSDTGNGSVNFQCVGNDLKISVDLPKTGSRVIELSRVAQ